MATRKIKDAKDLSTNELIYFKGHAKATFMSDGKTVEDAILEMETGGSGGILEETDPVFSASAAASITEEKKAEWDDKQDKILDLDVIREGAGLGTTALQFVPSEYITEEELNNKGYATTSALNDKVDKVSGKQLSTEDFTSTLKTKLEGLSNYDDTELSEALSTLRGDFDKLVSGDTTTAIKTFNEVIAFLDGIQDSQDLSSIIASIEQQVAEKMDKVTLAKVATSGSYNDLSNKPTIPTAVTESTVSGWGFTKNTGTYSKPSTGIPKTDLATAVQTSLGKADTALQSYTEQYKGTITGVSANGTSVATSGVANIPAASTSAYGVTKLSSATNSSSTSLAATASAVKAAYDLANSYKGTVTGVKVNGSTKSPSSGTVDIGNVVTSIKINGSTKTPSNGVVDLGTIEGGNSSSGGSSSGTSDINSVLLDATQSSFTLQPNTYGVLFANSGATYAFNFNAPSIEELRNGKIVEYGLRIAIGGYGSSLGSYLPVTLSFPEDVVWNYTPNFEKGVYDISFIPVASKAVKASIKFLGAVARFDVVNAGGDFSTSGPA